MQFLDILPSFALTESEAFLGHSNIRSFFDQLMFADADFVRHGLLSAFQEVDAHNLEPVVLGHLANSAGANCAEYFILLSRVSLTVSDPLELWLSLISALESNLFVPRPGLDLRNCEGDAQLENAVSQLSASEVDPNFVEGVTGVMFLLTDRITDLPSADRVFDLFVNRIIFNTAQFVPAPMRGFALLEVLLSRNPELFSLLMDNLVSPHADLAPLTKMLPLFAPNTRL
jgi:hypothetical protein